MKLRIGFFIFVALIFPYSAGWGQEEKKDTSRERQLLLWKVPPQGAKALLPDISLIGTFTGGYFRDDPVVDTGENPSRSGFNMQAVELAFQSVVDPYIRSDVFVLLFEAAIEVEDATITTLSLPLNLQVRAGRMLGRFGRQNTQHVEQIDFVDFSGTNRFFFGDEGFAELGAELSILLPTSWFSEFSFEFLQGENAGNFDGPRKGDLAYLGHWKNSFDLTKNLTMVSGLSGVFGYNASGANQLTQLYGGDIYFRWKPSKSRGLKWQTEYFLRRRDLAGVKDTVGGLYTQIVAQFARRWEGGLRVERIGLPHEGFRQWQLSPVLAFIPTEFFRIRSQYNYVKTDGVDRPHHEAFLQLQFNMGVHGAHVF